MEFLEDIAIPAETHYMPRDVGQECPTHQDVTTYVPAGGRGRFEAIYGCFASEEAAGGDDMSMTFQLLAVSSCAATSQITRRLPFNG